MSQIKRAIIYARVSSDPNGRGWSVAQQIEECQAFCKRMDWPVAEIVSDNDVGASRWSKGRRPGRRRLQQILSPGDVLVVWESSRTQRNLADYVDLRDLCAELGVFWSYKGRLYDPRDADDRFTTGFDALRDESESERIRDRVLRAARARAQVGRPNSRLPYGYRRIINPTTGHTDKWVPDEATAPVVREIVDRILAGETLRAIARDLNARRIPAPGRRPGMPPKEGWIISRMRLMIQSPSYAGLRTYRGDVIGQAAWEAIITEDEHRRLVAVLNDPHRLAYGRHGGPKPKHLLSGIARCGVCGDPLHYHGSPSKNQAAQYICRDQKHVSRRADKVDDMAHEAVRMLLADQRLTARLIKNEDDDGADEAMEAARALQQRLDAFVDEAAAGRLTAGALARIEAQLRPQIDEAEQRWRDRVAARDPRLTALVGNDAESRWEQLDLETQRDAIRALLDIRVMPTVQGQRKFDPTKVEIRWRAELSELEWWQKLQPANQRNPKRS